ncbi:MAG: peptidase [Planctomycetaceae bacterium]|nr:peptidase [Planctomycetaceae bacterium]
MLPSHTSRRGFLKTTGGMALAASAPAILGAEDKSGLKPPVIGPEGHRYQVHHDCMQLPDHIRWQDTHGVAVDAEGQIYVKHRTMTVEPQDAIVVFDGDGKFVRSFGKEFHGGGHGIDVRREGNEEFLYLCDNKGYIAKSTLRGEIVWKQTAPNIEPYADAKPFELTTPGKYGKGHLFSPTNIAFAPDGGFWVGDGYGSHYVTKYDQNANVVSYFGGAGDGPGQLQTPHGLWWDDRPGREPALVVADRANARLQYFSADGEHLSFFEDVLFPADIDLRGEVLLVPDLHARITLLDVNNEVIAHLGHDPSWLEEVLADNFAMRRQPERWVAGKFVHPHDACFDHEGNIYVAEWVAIGRVSKLKHVG